MQTSNRNKFVAGAAFILLTGIYYFYDRYMVIGGFGVGYQYIGCAMIILLGFGWFLIRPDPTYMARSVKTSAVIALPYVAVMLCTAVIWIFDFTPIRQMVSGFFAPSYMILCIVCAAFLVYIFRERAAEYSFWTLVIVLGALVWQRIRIFGVSEFVRRMIVYLRSWGSVPGGVSLESTDFAYSFAFFALYFLLCQEKEPVWKSVLRWAVIVLGLLQTFKRSALLALAAGWMVACLYSRLSGRRRRLFLNCIVVGFILCAFFIIPTIRSGLFTKIVNELHINTSTRTRIYAYYEQYYEFSMFYVGKGLGWIHRLTSTSDWTIGVHCDYVMFYIELGFFGYLVWLLTAFPWVVKRTVKGRAPLSDAVILGLCVGMSILRITENISQLYSANLTISIIIVQCCVNRWSKLESGKLYSEEGP